MNIVDGIMLSNFLAASFRATYACYINVEKMMVNHEGKPPLLMTLAKYVPAKMSVRSMHLDEQRPYI